MATDALAGREVIIELYPIGTVVKVTAIDAKTMTEVSIQGMATMSEYVLKSNALKKLEYVLRKKGHIA